MASKKNQKKKTKLSFVDPDKVKKIIEDVGRDRYRRYSSGSLSNFLTDLVDENSETTVVACSGLHSDYQYEDSGREFLVPSGSQVVIIRSLRECNHDGTTHYNADDSIIFKTKGGKHLRISRIESPDHYIELANLSGSLNIADAYRLPAEIEGHIERYSEDGAHWPIASNLKQNHNDAD